MAAPRRTSGPIRPAPRPGCARGRWPSSSEYPWPTLSEFTRENAPVAKPSVEGEGHRVGNIFGLKINGDRDHRHALAAGEPGLENRQRHGFGVQIALADVAA